MSLNCPMHHKQAWEIVGGLSNPSKMPCWGYSIPAKRCITGAKLREIKNSVCSVCYALKGRYMFGNVQGALERRYNSLDHPRWVEAMSLLHATRLHLKGGDKNFFRWHDSGDLQSVEHLERIAQVSKNVPNVQSWLPTREYAIVREYLETNGELPKNLTVRVSGYMLDGPPPLWAVKLGLPTSGVSKTGFTCPAPAQGNACVDCRECWAGKGNVNYKQH